MDPLHLAQLLGLPAGPYLLTSAGVIQRLDVARHDTPGRLTLVLELTALGAFVPLADLAAAPPPPPTPAAIPCPYPGCGQALTLAEIKDHYARHAAGLAEACPQPPEQLAPADTFRLLKIETVAATPVEGGDWTPLDTVIAPAVRQPPADAAVAAQIAAVRAGSQAAYPPCPECGRTDIKPQGMGPHRRHAHGVRPGKPAPDVAPLADEAERQRWAAPMADDDPPPACEFCGGPCLTLVACSRRRRTETQHSHRLAS